MTSDSVLVYFNPEIQVKLLCDADASEYGVGAVLVHDFSYIDFVEGRIPLDLLKIKIEARKDTILSKNYIWIEEGWPEKVELEYKSYFIRKSELNIEKGGAIG